MLRILRKSNPSGRFWIKIDGTDVRPALQESMSGKWSGDENKGDGHVEELRATYEERKASFNDFSPLIKSFQDDIVFLKVKQFKSFKIICSI